MADFKRRVLWIAILSTCLWGVACGELKSEDEDTGDKPGDSSGDTGTDGDTDTDTDADTDTDTDVDTDTDTDVDTDTDTDADSDGDAEPDGGELPDASVDGGDVTDTESTLDCFYDGALRSGKATEREWDGNNGNCSYTTDNLPQYYATVAASLFADSAACGRCMHIRNTKTDASLDAMVADRCPDGSESSCGVTEGDLALNAAAATALGVEKDGAEIEWYFAPCTFEGFDKIKLHFKNDANPDWFAVQVLNHRNAVRRVEVRGDGEWNEAPRQTWNYWVINQCCGEGPYDIRVTDIYDNVVTTSDVPFTPNATLDAAGQFPACGDDSDTDVVPPDTDTTPDPSIEPNQDSALRVSSPPTIDGTPSESIWHLDTKVEKTASGTPNNTAAFDAVWDDTYLYVAVKVTDDTICVGTETSAWWYDSVEVYLDPDNSKTSCDTSQEPYECYDDKDVQIAIKYTDDLSWHQFGDNTHNTGVAYEATGAAVDGGYTVEARIPWSGLGVTPTAGNVIGFDIGVNDNDMDACSGVNETSRSGEMRWQGDAANYQTTAHFGELVLFSRRAN